MNCGGAAIARLVALFAGLALLGGSHPLGATPEDRLVAAGKLKLAGRTMSCGGTPTLVSNTFWDYGGATRGRIILNPKKLATVPPPVRLYVYAHECGHQIYGANEPRADCYAVERGRREGWLTLRGVGQICEFLKDLPGDYVHPPGPKRCTAMITCFGKTKPRRARR